MKKTILFDLDGTLIDSTDAILQSFHVAYEIIGEPCPDDTAIKALIGYPLDIMFQRLGAKTAPQDCVDAYKSHYKHISKKMTEFLPFAKEAVEQASTFASLGIVTTKTAKYSQELLEHMQIMHHFDILIGRESVKNPKPHPEPVMRAMHSLKALKEHTWMVGDTILDLQAANASGIKSSAVLCGYGKHEDLCKYTNHIRQNAQEIVQDISIL